MAHWFISPCCTLMTTQTKYRGIYWYAVRSTYIAWNSMWVIQTHTYNEMCALQNIIEHLLWGMRALMCAYSLWMWQWEIQYDLPRFRFCTEKFKTDALKILYFNFYLNRPSDTPKKLWYVIFLNDFFFAISINTLMSCIQIQWKCYWNDKALAQSSQSNQYIYIHTYSMVQSHVNW